MDPEDEFDQEDDFYEEDQEEEYDLGQDEDEDEEEESAAAETEASESCCSKIKYSYEVLSPEKIAEKMAESIKEANLVLELPETVVRKLLSHFMWDTQKLLERFYESEKIEVLYEEANVVVAMETASQDFASSSSAMVDCEICFSNTDQSTLTGLECGHAYCCPCWTEYLTTKIMDEGASQSIECPGCPVPVKDQMVMDLLKEPKVKQKYRYLITNSFVECNRLMRWCPTPDCNHAIQVPYVQAEAVECQCGFTFCFECLEEQHEPLKCELLRKWKVKCSDDSETATWIAANTKECPKCKTSIEKRGGCRKMTCRKENCRFEFCWICMRDFRGHAYPPPAGATATNYPGCSGPPSDEAAKKAKSKKELSKLALQRYLFYRDRYMNHLQSHKLESKLYDKVNVQMEKMRLHNMSWIEVQFLKKAVDILCECRRTLMLTYAFAFYLDKTSQSVILEDNQKDLEHAIEALSEYLEKDISAASANDIKLMVLDKSRFCASRREKLLAHAQEGYAKGWWKFNDYVN